MTHDNSWPVALKFMSIGASKIHNNRQIVMTLDHDLQNHSESNLKKYSQQFSYQHGVDSTLLAGALATRSWLRRATPGRGRTPVVRTDAASIWATGRTWWQIPPIARVTLTGIMPPGVTGKDVIVALCGLFNNDDVLNHERCVDRPIPDRLCSPGVAPREGHCFCHDQSRSRGSAPPQSREDR